MGGRGGRESWWGGGKGGGICRREWRRLSSEKKLLAGQIIFSWVHEWIGDGTVEAEDGDDNDDDDVEAEEKASQSENATGRGGDWLQGRDLLPDMETLQETQKNDHGQKSGKNNQDQKTWETPSADFKGEKKTLQLKSIGPRADCSQKNVELVQETKSWLLASPS